MRPCTTRLALNRFFSSLKLFSPLFRSLLSELLCRSKSINWKTIIILSYTEYLEATDWKEETNLVVTLGQCLSNPLADFLEFLARFDNS